MLNFEETVDNAPVFSVQFSDQGRLKFPQEKTMTLELIYPMEMLRWTVTHPSPSIVQVVLADHTHVQIVQQSTRDRETDRQL